MSPLPLFLVATAVMSVVLLFRLFAMVRRPLAAPRPVGLRRRRAEEQIRWDRLHSPTTEGGA